jgi:hypothetical protein
VKNQEIRLVLRPENCVFIVVIPSSIEPPNNDQSLISTTDNTTNHISTTLPSHQTTDNQTTVDSNQKNDNMGFAQEAAQILCGLQRQRITFEEECNTSFLSFFKITDPQSNYFVARRWANDLTSSGFLMNAFRPTRKITLQERVVGSLTDSGKRMYHSPNAGGNSLWSEVLSFECMQILFGTTLVRTEMEILYGCHSKITDYSVQMFGHHFGVSVTRAMKFRGIFCAEDAIVLLKKKLNGILKSTRGVIRAHRWEKQILHIWAEWDYIADVVKRVYETEIEDEYKANTLVVCTVARESKWLF